MATRFITEVKASFNPFSRGAKTVRLFLCNLPPKARANGVNIATQMLPKNSTKPNTLLVKFKDGKEMSLDCENVGIKGVMEEINRHTRMLKKQADLSED